MGELQVTDPHIHDERICDAPYRTVYETPSHNLGGSPATLSADPKEDRQTMLLSPQKLLTGFIMMGGGKVMIPSNMPQVRLL